MVGNNMTEFDPRRFERSYEVSQGLSHRNNRYFQTDSATILLPASASNCVPVVSRDQRENDAPAARANMRAGNFSLPAIHNLTTFVDHPSPGVGNFAYVADSDARPFHMASQFPPQMRDSPITEEADTPSVAPPMEHQKRAEFWNTVMSQDHPIPHVSLNRSRRDDSADDERKGGRRSFFPCTRDGCTSTFGQRSNLNKHVRVVHEKLKPHPCHICKKSFAQKSVAVAHVKAVHHGIKEFACWICQQKFSDKSNRKKHVKLVHDKVRAHKCTICGRSFAEKRSLTEHLSSFHSVKACASDQFASSCSI